MRMGATTVKLLLEDSTFQYACISCDIKNAFNSRSRSTILTALYNSPKLKAL